MVDGISEDAVLEQVQEVLHHITKEKEGQIFESLSHDQKERVEISYNQIKDPTKLVSHTEAKKRLKRWL